MSRPGQEVLHEELLNGDAPGAALVAITVDGRVMAMPRMILHQVLTLAANYAYDRAAKVPEVERPYYAEALDDIQAISKFLASR